MGLRLLALATSSTRTAGLHLRMAIFAIAETRAEVSADQLIAAANDAIELWPDDRPYWEPPPLNR